MDRRYWLLSLTLSSLYAATLADHKEDMLAAEKACMVKFPTITPAVLNELKDVRDFPKFQASHSDLNCFAHCVMLELGVADENGDVHLENMKTLTVAATQQMMSHDETHDVITKCIEAAVHDDKCEKSGQYVACKAEKLKEIALDMGRHDVS